MRHAADEAPVLTGYSTNVAVLRSEYNRYYGKPIEQARFEVQFRHAGELAGGRDFPGAASILEMLSRNAAVPEVYTDLGVVYAMLGDFARAADSFREALARDSNYAPARQFLHTTNVITPSSADPYTRELEPNNESSNANLISLTTPVTAQIQSGGDVDYFRIVSPPAPRDLLAIELTNHSVGFAPQLRVYDANLRILNWGAKGGETGESVRVVGGPPANSPMYIAVSGQADARGPYVLSVKPQHAFDSYEPNDDLVSSRKISVGEEIHANIMDADDTDFYSFRSPRSGTVIIEIENNSHTLIPAITMYNPERRNLGFGPELRQPGAGLQQTMKVEKDLTYFVQVWSQTGTAGTYTFRVN